MMTPTPLMLLLGMALLASGCATLEPSGADGSRDAHARGLDTDVILVSTAGVAPREEAAPPGPLTCGGVAVPLGWPDSFSSEKELLAPFFTCTSPAEFLGLQQGVDMPRLVQALSDWGAVRLGALGPVREDAAHLLNLKRTAFLVAATERLGPLYAQVFAVFLVHSAHDDDLREMLFLLARDKQLKELRRLLPAFQMALEERRLKPTARADRDFEWKDVGRGLARAGRDALSTSPLMNGGGGFSLSSLQVHLPPQYQQALLEADKRWMEQHLSPGNVALGSFDHLTFGVPLGFYGLLAGTGHGAHSLSQGEYERATRELAPTVLLVSLYAGGKSMRALHEARGAPGPRVLSGLEPRLRALKDTARQLEGVLGVEGLRKLAQDIQASREAGRFVAVGGVDAALALRATRGNVAEARALMSRARPQAPAGPSAVKGAGRSPEQGAVGMERPGGLASLVDERAGLTREVVEARLALVELEAPGPRLPRNMAVLEKQRPSSSAPPPGAEGNPRWGEYAAYYEKRLKELEQGKSAEGPLRWGSYERMWGWFSRGLEFERLMVALLEADAALPRAQRRFLGAFIQPRILRGVGVWKPKSGLRYADVLVIEEGPVAGSPRVETFSFKSRALSGLKPDALRAQMIADAREALQKYGETLDIRRSTLLPLLREGSEVPVQRVRLVYEGGGLLPENVDTLKEAVSKTHASVPGVEVLFQ